MNIDDPKDNSLDKVQHYKWMRELKAGDLVCDCRCKHLRVVRVDEEYAVSFPQFISNLFFHEWVPSFIGDFLYDVCYWMLRTCGITKLVDKTLTLEDGSQCSAIHCCDPVEHAWQHLLDNKRGSDNSHAGYEPMWHVNHTDVE